MSLKSKAALIFLAIFVVYGAANYAVQQFVVLPSFISLEQNEAQKDLERAAQAIKREVHHLNTFCGDWSAWDDTYAFMASSSKKYIESNLILGTFTDNDINLIYFIDRGGKVIWGKIYDLKTENPIKLTGFRKGAFQGNHSLIPQQKQTEDSSQISVSGIVATEKGPMLVAARPIVTSENEGPSRGTLIMGRFLDGDLIKTLVDQSKVVFSIHPAGPDSSHEPKREIKGSFTFGSTYLFGKQGPSYLLVSTTFPDVEGNPAFLITAKIPRTISAKGSDTTRYAVISGFVSMLLVLIIMLFVLQRTILRPIIKLKNHAFSIGKTGDLSPRVSIRRRDEIGALGLELDHMMEKLEDRTDNLTELNKEMKKDIARRIQAEEALRESDEKYRLLVENASDAIFIAQDEVLKFANPKTEEMIGYSAEELAKISFVDLIHSDDRDKVLERHAKRLKGEKIPSIYSFRILNRSREELTVELNTVLITWEGRPATLNFLRDITAQQRFEAQLQHAQKMEAIGTLAGGVAHEFNNALMGIIGNIELLKMDLPEDERRDRYFGAMKGSSHRMSRLTDQLLAYAQGGKYRPENLKLDDFVIETLPILQHDLSPTIRVETHFPKDISYIKADHTQMQMVLFAILANSNESIEDEGLIKIFAEHKNLNEDFTKQHPGLKPGYYVCLTIEDDGEGMDEATRSGIFEPFFTTKFQGRGMGMAAVYGIVKNHDGWISVHSELGKGTVVQICLPAIEIELTKQKKAKVEVATGSGTILMIEDEDVVIEVTQAMLEMLGYRVMVAKTGKDAIHIAETFEGRIDLALLDIKLPDMEGGKVYPHIMEARPGLKVIVFSGFAIEGPARRILDAGAQDFIQKPFSLATLSEKLKKVLEGQTSFRG